MNYQEFLERKSQVGEKRGFKPLWLPPFLFDFQRHLAEWDILQGRAANFVSCGLGKTPIFFVWAENVVRHTNRPVLISTTLGDCEQAVREAAKFQVEAVRSKDGTIPAGKKIVVTNYERLHHFNPNDFAGFVGNECFPAGTKIQVLSRCNSLVWKYIEDIVPGDRILNASGVDRVKACVQRRVRGVVVLRVRGRSVTCSENHPFFTLHGWRRARDLRTGDHLVETATAMRLVRDGGCAEISGEQNGSFLRDILLREMAHEPSRAQSQGAYTGNTREDRAEGFRMATRWQRRGKATGRAYPIPESDDRSAIRGEDEGDENEERNAQNVEGQTGGQRHRLDRTRKDIGRSSRRRLGTVYSSDVVQERKRLSLSLPDRLREREPENCYRSGRLLSSLPQGAGQEEGRQAGLARVDRVEVLQQDDPRLERLRDADGSLRFYDLEAERHPSFSVEGFLVHNSSILKNFKGKRKATVTEFMRTIPYRLLCTATAAPNDYIELGTSSEALGELGYQDMLTRFFVKHLADRGTIGWGREQYRMKGHAERDFWRWACSWARSCRKPSDLGPFDDERFKLPPLIHREHIVSGSTRRSGYLFDLPAANMEEEREELRRTLRERCEKVAELVNHKEPALAWCYLNDEGRLLKKLIPDAVEISGADSDDEKEEAFEAFASGQIRCLISKPKIAGFGLNWQHCAHMTFFPSHSWEQWHQAIHRCLRFGQTKPVVNDVIATEGMRGTLDNLKHKEEKVDRMFSRLVELMGQAQRIGRTQYGTQQERLPAWLS